MDTNRAATWFTVVSAIMVVFGIVYAGFGLGVLPVDRGVLAAWSGGIYGAMMMGWGTTLFLFGRTARRRDDLELSRPILAGIAVWLVLEALISVRYRVWFNVAVDAGVLALFAVPLRAYMRAADDRATRRS